MSEPGPATDWTRAEIAALFDLPAARPALAGAADASPPSRAERGPALHPAVDQDRRLPGGLRLLQPVGARRDRAQGREADGRATRCSQPRREAKAAGSGRFCMGAAWREPKDRDIDALCEMVAGVQGDGPRDLHDPGHADARRQADALAEAGLDYYNHNLDTSPEHYGAIITTRTFRTGSTRWTACPRLGHGGLLRRHRRHGRDREDRVGFLHALATLPAHPESVPINALVPVKGTVLGDMLADTPLAKIDDIEFVRTVAVARITMPRSMVRLSAGPREHERDRRRRSASSPAPIRSSPATNC